MQKGWATTRHMACFAPQLCNAPCHERRATPRRANTPGPFRHHDYDEIRSCSAFISANSDRKIKPKTAAKFRFWATGGQPVVPRATAQIDQQKLTAEKSIIYAIKSKAPFRVLLCLWRRGRDSKLSPHALTEVSNYPQNKEKSLKH